MKVATAWTYWMSRISPLRAEPAAVEVVADIILDHLLLPIGRQDWPALWSRVSAPLAAFLASWRLGPRTGAGIRHPSTPGEKNRIGRPRRRPTPLGEHVSGELDLARRVPDVFLPPGAGPARLSTDLERQADRSGGIAGNRRADRPQDCKSDNGRTRAPTAATAASQRDNARSGPGVAWQTVRTLLRLRTLRLLYDVLAAKPKERLMCSKAGHARSRQRGQSQSIAGPCHET